ncbi:hypothetical protein [Microbispora triticiradicis]|uniref:hypothetical protein n=1 Tax=Microbispora triticiradicis TaxID=2200763 RepID=UPI001AD7D709|nr:hypothetical protein [Microbispora triticiradicis]MBO4275499.1 hypothetical protein [Microbispora triticiradicis]
MTLRLLSLGAGVQSTAILLLACDGTIPTFDAAIFADTGWEPKAVYDHLDRLAEHAAQHGIPVYRVSSGNIRRDALDPEARFASMPLYVISPCQICTPGATPGRVADLTGEVDGKHYIKYTGPCPRCGGTGKQPGMARRQCTSEYKLKPIKQKTRELLGYPHPKPVPKGLYVETAIGISLDEIGRARDSDVQYMRNVFPLLDLKWTRKDCERYLRRAGWGSTAKSACIGCPYHGNRAWRQIRDETPEEWADAVAFDHAIRNGSARANAAGQELRGSMYLHRSRVPLDQAPIDRVTRSEWRETHPTLFDEFEDGDPDGCSPWACRSGEAVA